MKTPIKILAVTMVVLALAYGLFTPPEAQSGQPDRTPAVVIIGFKQSYGPITGGSRPVTGLEVDWVNASSNAPVVIPGTSLAPVMASLLDQGFELSFIATTYQVYVRGK